MNDLAINLTDAQPVLEGEWHRDVDGRVKSVYCDCGYPVFYRDAIHARLVVPKDGTALCKNCRTMVRVPVCLPGDRGMMVT